METKYFDKTKWIKNNAPDITDHHFTNAQLHSKLADIQNFITELTNSSEIYSLTASQIKKRYLSKKEKEKYDFNTYFKYFASTKKADKTKEIYLYTLSLIEDYASGQLHFSDINSKFLRELELWMNDKGMKINSIGIHMRNIRAVFNAAIDDEVIDLGLYPFRKYKIKKEKTVKRNLTIDEIRRFKDIELAGVPGLSRDVFMLSFYLIGINLKDLSFLTKKDIKDGRVEYQRAKTGTHYSIKLEPEAKKLIKKLSGEKYLINLLERYQDYDGVKKEINKKLKDAAKKAKINKPVSTYYARHSWATIAADIDIPKETISAALGHEIGSKTTGIYIDYNLKKVDDANRKVINYLRG
ncbi:MAG: site-specific integrase [Candidatus Izemoplasmatales bacterium]|nr:site-specific integrase [Candidatus Izemoplasmatales bacterium]